MLKQQRRELMSGTGTVFLDTGPVPFEVAKMRLLPFVLRNDVERVVEEGKTLIDEGVEAETLVLALQELGREIAGVGDFIASPEGNILGLLRTKVA